MSEAEDDFSRQLLQGVLTFLEEGGDVDAASVLRACSFSAGHDYRFDILPAPVWVTLGCPRIVYEMFMQPDHPILNAIRYALVALEGDTTSPDVYFSRVPIDAADQATLTAIAAKYASTTGLPTQRGVITGASSEELDPTLCFVIMSFSSNPRLRDCYSLAVKPTVEEFGYRCERVDEQQFNGSIRQRIIENIQCARFIIADMTEARPNCYYELGMAHGLGKVVIHITSDPKDIHFDITDFNFILYDTVEKLKTLLRKRIEDTVGAALAS